MIDLLKFLIKNITGSDDFDVVEQDEDGRTILEVHAIPDIIGLIIGKEGKTIKNLRNIVKVRAVLENKSVNITVLEK